MALGYTDEEEAIKAWSRARPVSGRGWRGPAGLSGGGKRHELTGDINEGENMKVAYENTKEKKKGWLQHGVQLPVYVLQLSTAPPSQLVAAAV